MSETTIEPHVADIHINNLLSLIPFNHRDNIQRVLEDYTTIFGGRKTELAQLDAWLDNNEKSVMLIQAPAGRGKTALLSNWALKIQANYTAHVIFYPISIRYQTASADSTIRCLGTVLATLFNETPPSTNESPEMIAPKISEWLQRGLPHKERLILIVDALDETIGWKVQTIFPSQIGKGIQILVSARPLAGMYRLGWLSKMNWSTDNTKVMDLGGLDRHTLLDMLQQTKDDSLVSLTKNTGFVNEFERVSEGDPLTARMIIDALLNGDLTPKSLSRRPPGLDAYLADWLKDLESRIESKSSQLLLGFCATALGPFTTEDLNQLAPLTFKSEQDISHAVKKVNRFIIGNGTAESGYVFSHPRLREAFAERLPYQEKLAYQRAFNKYGENFFNLKLQSSSYTCPTYLRLYWITHLTELELWNKLQTVLLKRNPENGKYLWAEMRYAIEGSYAGFLTDLDNLWARTRRKGDIGVQLECALIHTSIRSLSSNLSPELLLTLLQFGTHEGRWSVSVALEHIRQMPDEEQQLTTLDLIIENIEDPPYPVMFDIMRHMRREFVQANTISMLAPNLPQTLIRDALIVIRSMENKHSQGIALMGLAPYLSEQLFPIALAMIKRINNYHYQAQALISFIPHLPQAMQQETMELAHNCVEHVWDYEDKAKILIQLADLLPEPSQNEMLANAFETIRMIGDSYQRGQILLELVCQTEGEFKENIIQETLIAIETASSSHRSLLLHDLIPHVLDNESFLQQALILARTIRDNYWHIKALLNISIHLPQERSQEILSEIYHVSSTIQYSYLSTKLLIELGNQLTDPDLQIKALQSALDIAWNIEDNYQRALSLVEVIPYLSIEIDLQEEMVHETYDIIRQLKIGYQRAELLIKLAPYFSKTFLPEALTIARSIENQYWQEESLRGVAVYLTAGFYIQPNMLRRGTLFDQTQLTEWEQKLERDKTLQAEALSEVLTSAKAIRDAEHWSKVLLDLAPYLPSNILAEALLLTRRISDIKLKSIVMIRLGTYLPTALHSEAVQESLHIISTITNNDDMVNIIDQIIPYLPRTTSQNKLSRSMWIDDALNIIKKMEQMGDKNNACRALSAFIPAIHNEITKSKLLNNLVQRVNEITLEDHRAYVIVSLAPHLSESHLKTILTIVQNLKDEYHRSETLLSLVLACGRHDDGTGFGATTLALSNQGLTLQEQKSSLFETIAKESLAVAETIGAGYQHYFGSVIAAKHPPKQKPNKQYIRRGMLALERRSKTFVKLAGYLPTTLQPTAFQKALDAAYVLPAGKRQVNLLIDLLDYLPPNMKTETALKTLSLARQLPHQDKWQESPASQALVRLVEYLPSKLHANVLHEIKTIAESVQDMQAWGKSITMEIHVLPSKEHRKLFFKVCMISDDILRTQILTELIPHFSKELKYEALKEAFTSAQSIPNLEKQAHALMKLSQYLSTDFSNQAFLQALKLITSLDDQNHRLETFERFMPYLLEWAKRDPQAAKANLQMTIRVLAMRSRAVFLEDLHQLMPFSLSFGDDKLAIRTWQAIRAVISAWH